MDIMAKEVVHVIIKIQGFIVLSIIMSQFSIYFRFSPSPTFKGFHKTRQGKPHLKQTLPWQNAPLKKPPLTPNACKKKYSDIPREIFTKL